MVRTTAPGAARRRLGAMLAELLRARGIGQREAARLVPADALSPSTLRNWCQGIAAPQAEDVFRRLVGQLEDLGTPALYRREEWESALQDARDESDADRRASRDARRRRGRTGERSVMRAFVDDRSPRASSYLWWHAELPVGKTAMLADFAGRPPEHTEVLFLALSEKDGTDTSRGFLAALRGRLQVPPPRRTLSAEADAARMLTRAAGRSREQGRQLVLVVDGLDEDRAWPVPGVRAPGAGSVAALLPAAPAPNVRIIVSSRRTGPLPADVPHWHPLSLRECLRPLGAGDWGREVEQAALASLERLRASGPGRAVTDLLALTDEGGGLRPADLAELTGVGSVEVTRLLHDRDQRCIVLDDVATGTRLLSHSDLADRIRRELRGAEVAEYTRRLHAWAARRREAGWPEDTSPYLLTGYSRLLDGPAERGPYLLDPPRQLRVANTMGPQLVLEQLSDLESEFRATGNSGTEADDLVTAVRLAASQDLVQRRVGPVPPRVPVLLAQLGDLPRAREVARSEPELMLRASRLAEVAVAAARARHPDAPGIAREAAECTVRAGRFGPRTGGVFEDACAEVADAARSLASLGLKEEARALFRAVVLSGGADLDTLADGAVLLAGGERERFLEVLAAHAEDLSTAGPRAQAVAVDIWATVARADSSGSSVNLRRIDALCQDVDLSTGLVVVDVLALAARALAAAGRREKAWEVLRTARDRLFISLTGPQSPADRAHLGREFSGTMERLVRAETAAGTGLRPHLDARLLVTALARGVRTGILGDDLLARAEAYLAAVDELVAAEDAAHRAAKEEERRAHRRDVDESAAKLNAERLGHGRSDRTPSAPRRRAAPTGEAPPAGPVTRLQYAEDLLRDGNTELGREQLDAVLRASLLPSSPLALRGPWADDLLRAMGTAGVFGQAQQLIGFSAEPADRARHFAALSLGCAVGGREAEALAYAREAARLVPPAPHFAVRGAVAQALAHAGDAERAVALAQLEEPPDDGAPASVRARRTRRGLLVVAAGLARHAPDAAAELAGPALLLVRRRTDAGRPGGGLAALAELLLTLPDPGRPGPELGEAVRLAAEFTRTPRQTWNREAAVVLAVLRRLDFAPVRTSGDPEGWLRSLRPERVPHAGLALLGALGRDPAAARRIADAAPTQAARSEALAAAASVLAGAGAVLPVEETEESAVRTCLALVHANARERGGRPGPTGADREAALGLLRELLADRSWTRAVPLLPLLAPEALEPLGDLVAAHLGGGRTPTRPAPSGHSGHSGHSG